MLSDREERWFFDRALRSTLTFFANLGVFPGQYFKYSQYDKEKYAALFLELQQEIEKRKLGTVQKIKVPLKSGLSLDAVLFLPNDAPTKFQIRVPGNRRSFKAVEFIDQKVLPTDTIADNEILNDFAAYNCGIAIFDYSRSGCEGDVEASECVTPELLKNDIRSMINFVLEKFPHLESKDIMLKAESLGAALSSWAAFELFQENKPIYLANLRSFSENSLVLKPSVIISFLLDLADGGWNLHIGSKYWDFIPDEYKIIIEADPDPIIGRNASLLQYEINKYAADKQCELLNQFRFKSILPANFSSHIIPLRFLINEEGKTAHQVLNQFMQYQCQFPVREGVSESLKCY